MVAVLLRESDLPGLLSLPHTEEGWQCPHAPHLKSQGLMTAEDTQEFGLSCHWCSWMLPYLDSLGASGASHPPCMGGAGLEAKTDLGVLTLLFSLRQHRPTGIQWLLVAACQC